MYAVQIRAGNDPPVTLDMPPVPDSDIELPALSDRAIMTAVASCGVYPTNQAERLLSVVPVLPAAGRPSPRAAKPVPSLTTFRSA